MKKKLIDPKKFVAWCVYILECGDGTLYTGSTNNLKKRITKHTNGTGSKYVRAHLPVKLLYCESCSNRSTAVIREEEIKKLSRQKKLQLVNDV